MIVLVGSTRPAKVQGVRDALAAIGQRHPAFAGADLVTHDLTAIAPRMPMTVAEIIAGARRRAEVLIERRPAPSRPAGPASDHVFAIGLEGGVDPLPDVVGYWTLQTWSAITDGDRWGFGAGPALLLPERVSARVAAGAELGDVIDELAAEAVRGTRGAWGVLTHDLIGRRDAFRLAVIAAFAPFYNASAWRK